MCRVQKFGHRRPDHREIQGDSSAVLGAGAGARGGALSFAHERPWPRPSAPMIVGAPQPSKGCVSRAATWRRKCGPRRVLAFSASHDIGICDAIHDGSLQRVAFRIV